MDTTTSLHPAFREVRVRDLPFGIRAHHLRHERSGAEVLALLSDEPNASFGVGFPTLASDDTGVAHILEHMVLAGSERFPLKDPFFDMIKGSLAGFINAFTAPDRTVYPFASENRKDFLNLLDVYLDAVFRARLNAETFAQEAWHLERDGDELAYRGVVFNEMKGGTAEPMRALHQAVTSGLFPDTDYRFEFGGDPESIPDLTYEDLLAFYRAHYHPSRARFVLHGAVPLPETLDRLDAYLRDAEPLEPIRPPALQTPFEAPRQVEATYPADDDGKAFASVAWALDEPDGPAELLVWDVLEHVLVGNPGAPLRRALLDAGLGEAFVGGLDASLRQPVFSAGLRGVDPERVDEVVPLVLDTLRRLAEEGLPSEAVEAARNAVEFDLREMDAYGGQRGVALAASAIGTWMHGADPLDELDIDASIADLDARLGGDPAGTVTERMRRALVDGTHRVDVRVLPDPEWLTRRDADERARLQALRDGMREADLAEVDRQEEHLAAYQQAPDPPEAAAALPYLRRADLDPDTPEVPVEPTERADVPIRRHPLATGGLAYLDLAFDLRALPTRLLPYAGLLARALLETGTRRRSVEALSQAIDRDTGGISASPWASSGVDGPGPARLMVRGRALAGRSDALADLLLEVLTEARLDDVQRLRGLLLEEKARREAALLPRGHALAAGRVSAHADEASRASDALQGLASLAFLRQAVTRIDAEPDAVVADLEEVRRRLLSRRGLTVGVTREADDAARVDAATSRVVDGLPDGEDAPAEPWAFAAQAPREGFPVSAQVHYVAAGLRLGEGRVSGADLAATQHLTGNVLVPRVRFQGGAYGAGARLDPLSGALAFYSYRDPNLLDTLAVYRDAPAELRRAAKELPEAEWDRLVVGASKSLDGYLLPGARGYRELQRYLRGLDAARRRALRDELLAAGPGDFEAFAERLEAAGEANLAVLGPRDSLERAASAAGLEIVSGVTDAG